MDIMLDIESWGTTPGCDIRSIGAVAFDPVAGWVGGNNRHVLGMDNNAPRGKTFYIACDNPSDGGAPCPPAMKNVRLPDGTQWYFDGVDMLRKYPLTRDPQTVQWWSEQSDEAQAAFTDPVDLREALERFSLWYQALEQSTPYAPRLWSHGSHFDVPILAAAYQAVGLPVPWHYRAPRDTRTIFDAAGIDDHSAWLNQHPGPLGLQHHALDDSICQARAVCAAMRIIRRWRNTANTDDGLVSHLNNIVAGIDDEGDRVYFGSTNDADHLREIAADLDANRFERNYDVTECE